MNISCHDFKINIFRLRPWSIRLHNQRQASVQNVPFCFQLNEILCWTFATFGNRRRPGSSRPVLVSLTQRYGTCQPENPSLHHKGQLAELCLTGRTSERRRRSEKSNWWGRFVFTDGVVGRGVVSLKPCVTLAYSPSVNVSESEPHSK